MTTKQAAKATKANATKAPTVAQKRAKVLASAGVRITKPGAGRSVGLPAGLREKVAASGVTFATWKIELGGIDAKLRAWNCETLLVIPKAGLDGAALGCIAAEWNSRATLVEDTGDFVIFAKASK